MFEWLPDLTTVMFLPIMLLALLLQFGVLTAAAYIGCRLALRSQPGTRTPV